jgi:F-type H+-transporting ATPase subunit gamma
MAKGMREIKRQIKSIQNTKQITKAMEMIAAARLKRAQNAAQAARPYAQMMRQVIESIAQGGTIGHPMLQQRPVRNVGYFVITSDRGLAGGYNANLLRMMQATVLQQQAAGKSVEVYVVGRKGRDFFKRINQTATMDLTGLGDFPVFGDLKTIASYAVSRYEQGNIDQLVLVYNEFVSVISQQPVEKTLLPIDPSQLTAKKTARYEFEPSAERVLALLLPRYAETMMYTALLEAKASEFGARMTAMSNATKNATKFIQELTLLYNRARQASITQEITEIVAGANAQ